MTDRFAAAFPYVDFFSMKGDRPTKWERIPATDLGAHVARVTGSATYVSVQSFNEAVPPEADTPEVHYAPPYADFDSTDPAESQRDVRRLIDFCKTDLDLDDDEIRVWFSGQKGFHLVLSPVAFGVEPSHDLTYIYKRMFGHLKEYLGLTTLDGSVYSKRRMWRVPNTQHGKSGLYKRELDHDQITDTLDAIKALAASPCKALVADEDFTAHVRLEAVDFFGRFRDEYLTERIAASSSTAVRLVPDAAPGDPICVTDIMGRGLKKPGDRNKATLVLGSYYKDVGRDEALAITDITDWALRLPKEHRRMDERYIKANTSSVVKSVYEGDGYHFACNFIRSLHGEKPKDGSGKYDRVACAGDDCPFIAGPMVSVEVPEVHLSKIVDVERIGVPIKVRMRIAGRSESPYLVPRKIEVYSTSEECDRSGCVLHAADGHQIKDFTKDLRIIVALCNVPDLQQKTMIREAIMKTSCKRFGYKVLEQIAVSECAAVPKAHTVVGSKGEGVDGDYTYQRVYVLGDEDLKVNSYYEVIGEVHPHPKTQAGTLIVTSVTALQDEIENFDLAESLPLFKHYGGDPEETFGHLLADLSVNVTKVGGRKHALLAVLMTMHAPLYLRMGGERYGGWMSTLIVGDTGEAKSQMVERLLAFTGLGDLVNAQNAGRTGLLYTIINKDTTHNFIQWGSFVLNDRGLLCIDEASGLRKEEYAELRNARRDGVFKVTRSVNGEAATRTRLLALSNPQWGKSMRSFQTGIEATTHLFQNADIRRFDLVVGFTAGEVKRADFEAELAEGVEHIFTAEVLRANILWAWSRKAEDIYWHPGVEARIKSAAKRLNQKYAGSQIHLLSQDAEEKIARMSQAFAAVLHSTDDLHVMLHVRPEHVEAVEEMVDAMYCAKDLEYDIYVRKNSEPATLDYDKLEFDFTTSMDILGVDPHEICRVFDKNPSVSNIVLEAVVGDAKATKQVIKSLLKHTLIRSSQRNGFETTARFNELLRMWHHRTGE